MPAPPPTTYVIAGCNGAGKTTFAREFLPTEVRCLRFLNADEIARALSPLAPSAASITAGRLLLSEVRSCLRKGETFALGSTLSGLTYVRLFQRARSLGYQIELHYLWLSSAVQAIARVRQRVEKGGHGVPAADIRRRFDRSLANLLSAYLPLADRWAVWDNHGRDPQMLASPATHGTVRARQILRS